MKPQITVTISSNNGNQLPVITVSPDGDITIRGGSITAITPSNAPNTFTPGDVTNVNYGARLDPREGLGMWQSNPVPFASAMSNTHPLNMDGRPRGMFSSPSDEVCTRRQSLLDSVISQRLKMLLSGKSGTLHLISDICKMMIGTSPLYMPPVIDHYVVQDPSCPNINIWFKQFDHGNVFATMFNGRNNVTEDISLISLETIYQLNNIKGAVFNDPEKFAIIVGAKSDFICALIVHSTAKDPRTSFSELYQGVFHKEITEAQSAMVSRKSSEESEKSLIQKIISTVEEVGTYNTDHIKIAQYISGKLDAVMSKLPEGEHEGTAAIKWLSGSKQIVGVVVLRFSPNSSDSSPSLHLFDNETGNNYQIEPGNLLSCPEDQIIEQNIIIARDADGKLVLAVS